MASAAMVVYCFDTLHAHFDGSNEPAPDFDIRQKLYVATLYSAPMCAFLCTRRLALELLLMACVYFVSSPLFVTWEIERQHGLDLRGCIGTLSPTRLQNLRDFTFKSALKDRRFEPIRPQELHHLHCSVSLLINYEDAEHYEDWEVRLHAFLYVSAVLYPRA